MYGKEPQYNETSLQRTHFASHLALCHIEVILSVVLGYESQGLKQPSFTGFLLLLKQTRALKL